MGFGGPGPETGGYLGSLGSSFFMPKARCEIFEGSGLFRLTRPAKAPTDEDYFYDLTVSDIDNALEASLTELDPRPPDEAYFHDPFSTTSNPHHDSRPAGDQPND